MKLSILVTLLRSGFMKIRVIISSEKEKEIMLGAKEITDIMGFDIGLSLIHI